MSRFGTLSAHAPSESVRLRFVWNATRSVGVLADLDQAGVHARRVVLHGALEQQVAARVRCVVVLDRAEVVHLGAAGEVQRDLLGAAALARQPGLGACTHVVAAERDRGEQRRGVAIADRLLVADLPRVDRRPR